MTKLLLHMELTKSERADSSQGSGLYSPTLTITCITWQ